MNSQSYNIIADIVHHKLGVRVDINQKFMHDISVCAAKLNQSLPEVIDSLKKERLSSATWLKVIAAVAIGETYFFRHQEHIDLLREHVLPHLLKVNQASRRLRIWSAGCATGEEVYTIAILLDELGAWHTGWSIDLLGTDMNQQALEKAKAGRYSDWSFRRTDPALRQQYFKQQANRWQLAEHIRRRAHFLQDNLAAKSPGFVLGDLDLVICRNVLIYLDEPTINQAVGRMISSLKPGGILITGHSELLGHPTPGMNVRRFPGAAYLEKQPPATAITAKIERNRKVVPDEPARRRPVAVKPVETRTRQPPASHQSAQPKPETSDFQGMMQSARHLAAAGNYTEAETKATAASQLREFAHEPYYLMSWIAELEGDKEKSRKLLDQTIYLAPEFAPAYIDLAEMEVKEKRLSRARALFATSLRLLNEMPAEKLVEIYDEVSAEELIEHVNQNLVRLEEEASSDALRAESGGE